MSIKTWKQMYYPTYAKRFKKVVSSFSELSKDEVLAAIDHSIMKWLGALPENTTPHQVAYVAYAIDGECAAELGFGAASCALCQMFNPDYLCDVCPVGYFGTKCGSAASAYRRSKNNVALMVQTLNEVRQLVELNWESYKQQVLNNVDIYKPIVIES